jgi:hypothetical protein
MRYRLLAQVVLVGGLLSSWSSAQDPFFGPDIGGGGMGGPGSSPSPRKPKAQPKPPPGTPELHAASGAGDEVIAPGSEPTLPTEPLKVSKETLERIGSDAALDEIELGRSSQVEHDFYGPYYAERSGTYNFKTLFPLWIERNKPSLTDPTKNDRASLFGGLYYNRRSADHADDILFPIFWNLTDPTSRTTVVGPFVNRVAPDETDNWLAPLYFVGSRKQGGYTILPPLLTYLNSSEEGGLNIIGPYFCSWKSGVSCSSKKAEDIDLGVAPFFFFGHDQDSYYRLIPPLLHYHAEDQKRDTSTNIWGPYYRHHSEEREALHLLPLFLSLWG